MNDASVLREAACAALGLALLPSSLVARELASGRLDGAARFPET